MDRVKKDFNKYAKYYDHHNSIQNIALNHLERFIGKNNLENKTIIDLGCGSGNFLNNKNGIQLDFSYNMCEIAKHKNNNPTICCDIEKMPINNKFDIAISSFTLQWLSLSSINKIMNICNNLYFAIPISGSLHQLEKSYEAINKYPKIHKFYSFEDIEKLDLVKYEIIDHNLEFNNFFNLLYSIKKIGGSYKEKNEYVNIRQLEKIYNNNFGNILSWKILYGQKI